MAKFIYSLEVDVDFEHFFLIGKPRRIPPRFTIELTEHTYLPKIDNPRRDWVSSVAVPAFLAYRAQNQVRTFATIGTGAGLDAIGACDIFDLDQIAVTDIHEGVVDAARRNICKATAGIGVHLVAATGDLLCPLADHSGTYDLIYENLPNIPMRPDCAIDDGQTSATYVPGRTEEIPLVATANLLALHFLALCQAKPLLSPNGAVLSSIGGRVCIDILLEMAVEAGYSAKILTYTWKIQSEPEEVIGGYKKNQEDGLGPFYFYPVSVLEKNFGCMTPAEAGSKAKQIEATLYQHRADAAVAYDLHANGLIMGHTVVIVQSKPAAM
ncbi:hypothetical protein B0H14DRAFT_2345199 [Mycena olivaceomarginata]|nr:hypothetical protein B0H14DRAFT_2345199 [Mycena olivaceomarginata]